MKNFTIRIMIIGILSLSAFTKCNAQWGYTMPNAYPVNTPTLFGMGDYFLGNANAPSYLLDLDNSGGNSDINIGRAGVTDMFGIRFGHNYVLWHNGNPNNIFVGVGAGNTSAN